MRNTCILFVDGVGPFGGASRSLYEICLYLKSNNLCNPFFLCTRGSSVPWYSKISTNIIISKGLFRFDNTLHSYYRGIRWLIILREIFKLPSSIFYSLKAYYLWRGKIDIIHCNEITEIFPSLFLKFLFKIPLFVHVRSVQSNSVNPLRSLFISWLCNHFVDKVIFIDKIVERSMPLVNGIVIHNSLNIIISDFEIKNMVHYRRNLEILNVVFLGNLQNAKGFNDLLDAFLIIKNRGFKNIRLNIYGNNTYSRGKFLFFILSIFGFSSDSHFSPIQLIHEMRLQDFVNLNGFASVLNDVFLNAHVLVFASHYDAPGRPVFEAGFFAVPSIVAVKNPIDDTFISGKTGLTVDAKNPKDLADKIIYLYNNRKTLEIMGENARKIALDSHSIDKNGFILASAYYEFT